MDATTERLPTYLKHSNQGKRVSSNYATAVLGLTDSLESLRGELAKSKRQAESALREKQQLETERKSLVEQVVSLEAQRRELLQEAEKWRQRCLEYEQECAAVVAREDAAQAKLRQAHNRERDLAVRHIEGRIARTEAENSQFKAEAEARDQICESHALQNKLISTILQMDSLRPQLVEQRTLAQTSSAEAQSLKEQLRISLAEKEEQQEALAEEARRHAVLKERIAGFETALKAASVKQIAYATEVDNAHAKIRDLQEVNARLRLDLQESIEQAVRTGEIPFYSGSSKGLIDIPAVAHDLKSKEPPPMGMWTSLQPSPVPLDQLASPRSPRTPLSPRSRLDYPKCSHARQLRQKVLDAREEAINKMEKLKQ